MFARIISFVIFLLFVQGSYGLPLYSARAARLCDNCHLSPFTSNRQQEWKNPKLADRKCNMSCQSCHVNPAGGMLRRAPGRYYTMSTLPMFGSHRRPFHDQKEIRIGQLLVFFKNEKLNNHKNPKKHLVLSQRSPKKSQLRDLSDSPVSLSPGRLISSETAGGKVESEWLSFGLPLGITKTNQSPYTHWIGRYGEINAAPLVSIGGNFRLASVYQDRHSLFRMQADIGVALQPIEHMTLTATGGVQGRKKRATTQKSSRLKFQNAYLMLHDFPYQAYMQGGLFLPEFGMRTDDHTAFGREYFEMNNAFSDNDVVGVQIGAAPNYPHFSTALFYTVNNKREQTGWGITSNFGWRDIAWGVGSSFMLKRREHDKGGNLTAISLYSYYNLWQLIPKIRYTDPITLLIEFNYGEKERSEIIKQELATYHTEIHYLLINGVNLKANYMGVFLDITKKNQFKERIGLGFDWHIIRHLRLSSEIRFNRPKTYKGPFELITFLHWYF